MPDDRDQRVSGSGAAPALRGGAASEIDPDPQETKEWLDALEGVLSNEGVERAHHLIEALIDKARRAGANLPYKATTAYVNTIAVSDEARNPVQSWLLRNAVPKSYEGPTQTGKGGEDVAIEEIVISSEGFEIEA